MAVKKITKPESTQAHKSSAPVSSGAKADAKEDTKQKVVANPRLLEALQNYDEAKSQAKSYLISVATIAQEEQLTKEEIVVTIMEARGVDRETAKQQYSRISKLLTKPDVLEELREGIIDLATARAKTVTKQKNPSAKKKQENAEKRILTGITMIVNAAKEMGMDLQALISTLKEKAKKADLK